MQRYGAEGVRENNEILIFGSSTMDAHLMQGHTKHVVRLELVWIELHMQVSIG